MNWPTRLHSIVIFSRGDLARLDEMGKVGHSEPLLVETSSPVPLLPAPSHPLNPPKTLQNPSETFPPPPLLLSNPPLVLPTWLNINPLSDICFFSLLLTTWLCNCSHLFAGSARLLWIIPDSWWNQPELDSFRGRCRNWNGFQLAPDQKRLPSSFAFHLQQLATR